MQLGTRWPVGAEPPTRLPDAVVQTIRSVESDLTDVDTAQWRWTLTWLEGRPVVELDDGTVIGYDPRTGAARVRPPSEEDESPDEDLPESG